MLELLNTKVYWFKVNYRLLQFACEQTTVGEIRVTGCNMDEEGRQREEVKGSPHEGVVNGTAEGSGEREDATNGASA